MADLRTAQQFRALDQARDEWVLQKTKDPRRALSIERLWTEEAVAALVSDHPEATRPLVQSVLAGKPSKDTRLQTAIRNAQRAVDRLMAFAGSGKDIEEALLPALHQELLQGIDPQAGQYRSGAAKPILPGYTPSDAAFVPRALRNTFGWLSTASFNEIHPVEQAALVCARILEIQPFAAGNLKAAQLLASTPLIAQGFPPVVFRREDQPLFLRALSMAFLLAMQEMIDLYLQTLERRLKQATL